jgi:hypothetical protein
VSEGYKGVYVYTTVDFNILFVFTYEFKNDTPQDSILEPKWKVYGSILQKGSNQLSDQFLIYQTSISQFMNVFPTCDKFYNGDGFYCDLTFIPTDVMNGGAVLMIKVTFLLNGKITGTDMDLNRMGFDVSSFQNRYALKSGGFIITATHDVNYGCDVNPYLLDSNSFNTTIQNNYTTIHSNLSCIDINFTIMDNSTGLIIQEIKENYWTFSAVDFPQLMKGNYLTIYSTFLFFFKRNNIKITIFLFR